MSDNDIIVVQVMFLGCGGVGILCIFGFKVCEVVEIVLGKLFKLCYVDYFLFKDVDGSVFDQGIVLWFFGLNLFIGEDVLEL